MISNQLNIATSTNSIPTWGIFFPLTAFKANLSAGVEQTLIVPVNVNVAIFGYSAGSNVQVTSGLSEILPIGPFIPCNSRLNPTVSWVQPGEILKFITPDTNALVYVSFYNNDEKS